MLSRLDQNYDSSLFSFSIFWAFSDIWFQVLSYCLAQELDEQDNEIIRAYFRWDAEGWNATTKEGEVWPSSSEFGQLRSNDEDDTIWYYTASSDFLGSESKGEEERSRSLAGNKVEAYGGTVGFTLGHSEYNSLGLGAQEDFDLILESAVHNISLGHKHIVPGDS